jgi:PAS domain S-box-containing protein
VTSPWPRPAPAIVYTFDATGICTMSEGPGLERLGLRPGQMVGVDLLEAYAADPLALAQLERCLAGEAFTNEIEHAGRVLETWFQPLSMADGSRAGGLGVVSDVTEQRRLETAAREAARRSVALVDLTAALARDVVDPEALLSTAVRAAAEGTGSSGAVWLLDPDRGCLTIGAFEPLERGGRRVLPPEGQVVLEDLEIQGAAVEGIERAELIDLRSVAEREDWFGSDRLTSWLQESGAHSCLRVPLRARGTLLGAMDLVRRQEHPMFTDVDIEFAVDVAERCALALDNALLLQAQRVALEELVKFEAMADATSDLIAIADPDGVTQYANARVSDAGVAWQGRGIRDLVQEHVAGDLLHDIEEALAARSRWSAADVVLELPVGQASARLEVFPIAHPRTGEPLGSVWLAQDVTELRSAELALRAANLDLMRFEALVEACPEFIAIAGLDGAVTYVNPPGRRMVGIPDDLDVTETTIADFLTEDGLQRSLTVEQPAVVAQGHWEGESTLRDWRGGPPVPVSIASFLIRDPETGAPFALATVQRDLSDRVAAEAKLRTLAEQRQQLLTRLVDAQDAERAHIAAEVHDDSVQVLAAVDLRLGLLARRIGNDAPELLEYVDPLRATVSEATDRLRSLLFDLTPVDLEHGLAAALREVAWEMYDDSDTEVSVVSDDLAGLSTPTLRVAYRIAKEAMFNARKHARARHVRVTLRDVDGGLALSVRDDGIGIPDDRLGRITGHLGLANMEDRAQIAGGDWAIRRCPTGGTEVLTWLPGSQDGHLSKTSAQHE